MRRPLVWEEVERLLSAAPESDAVLVGGQAVSFWSRLYLEQPVASVDLDLFGSAEDACDWAKALGAECRIPSLSDPTPNSALLRVEMGGRLVTVDFLASVEGLGNAEIRSSALPFDLAGRKILVLHPLLCLESRVQNFRFPAKRDAHSLEQLETSIRFVRAFIDERLAKGEIRASLKCCERIFRLAESQYAKLVWHLHGIDVLEAIPKSEAQRHPRACAKIFSARRKFKQLMEQQDSASVSQQDRDSDTDFRP